MSSARYESSMIFGSSFELHRLVNTLPLLLVEDYTLSYIAIRANFGSSIVLFGSEKLIKLRNEVDEIR